MTQDDTDCTFITSAGYGVKADTNKNVWCFTRSGGDVSDVDYCYNPNAKSSDSDAPLDFNHWSEQDQKLDGKMQNCWGDCDLDSNCQGDLKCFQRDDNTPVPGCNFGNAGDVKGWDYCYDPRAKLPAPSCTDLKAPKNGATCSACPTGYDSTPRTVNGKTVCVDTNGCKSSPCHSLSKCTDAKAPATGAAGFTCSPCPSGYQGSAIGSKGCVDANDCADSLVAVHVSAHDLSFNGRMPACMGDCDEDSNCKKGLKCFQRSGQTSVPGCAGAGSSQDTKDADFCYDPSFDAKERPTIKLNFVNWSAETTKYTGNMELCEGDCDVDAHCRTGLKCFQRNNNAPIAGCAVGGYGDIAGWDYCYNPTWNDASGPCGENALTSDGCKDMGRNKYKCSCKSGYVSVGSPPTCVLADACAAGENDCVSNAKCNHVGGDDKHGFYPRHSCTCPQGYEGDGKSGNVAMVAWHADAHAQSKKGRMVMCEGDCDVDANCAPGHKCFQRNVNEAVPGCLHASIRVVNAYSVVNSTANGIYTWDGKTLVSSKAKYVLVDHVEQTIEWVSDRWRILREGKYFTDSAYTKSSSGVHPSSSGWLTASGRYVPSVKAGENMAGDVKGMDFCYNPNITMSSVPLKATDWSADSQSSNGRMNKCEGDCDDDKNCPAS